MTAYASLGSLLAPPLSPQLLTQLLALLQLGGFPATAWDSGSAGPVFANTEAQAIASLGQALKSIVAGGYLPLPGQPSSGAAGAWLDLLGQQIFRSPRSLATFTKGSVLLTDVANAGPFDINPNGMTCEDPSRTYLFQSTNPEVLTLPLGGTLVVPAQAMAAGAGYNLANGGISILLTSLAGVTVANPALGSTGTWITSVGTNDETDAFYAQRLANKWAILGSGSNTGAYYYNATTPSVTGSTEVVQCAVFSSGGAVTIVVSGATGPISSAGLALVNAAIQAKRPLTVPVTVINGVPSNTPFTGNVFVDGQHDPIATLAAVQVAISGLLQTIPMGGTLYVDQVIAVVMGVPGVYNLTLLSPASTVTLSSTGVLTPVFALTSSH